MRARATLIEMQRRISRGPHAALGVDDAASPERVRAAFLELTKQFHPARFGRMSTELQRMSNEVFLGIKSAHESMLRALGMSPRPGGTQRNQQSGAIPIITAEGSSKMPQSRPANPAPRAVGTGVQQPMRPAIPRTLTPGGRVPSPARTGQTPAHGIRTMAPTLQRTPPPASTGQTPPHGIRTTPTPAQGIRTTPTPAHGIRTVARPGTPPGTPPTRPGTPPQHPPQPTNEPPPATQRGIGPMPHKAAPVFDEQIELKQVLAHIAANNWVGARQVLNGLAARMPASKQYRALLCYTRGREAQLAGKGEEAVMELQRALQLDPDLSLAKSALDDVYRRR